MTAITDSIAGLESASPMECRPEVFIEALNAVYEGYLIRLSMTLERFERRFRGADLDPFACRLWHREGKPAALLLIATRPREPFRGVRGCSGSPRVRHGSFGMRVCPLRGPEAR
ncbi:MAG: hypothetical protein JWO25_2829 [Alphaproteobacteria bacterium]|nr:hypothetical protein [Alphaproteobacteria bacterium]